MGRKRKNKVSTQSRRRSDSDSSDQSPSSSSPRKRVRPAGAGGGCGNAFKELPYSTKKLSYPPFQRRFWAGPSPEAEPPEDLKLQRKAMGVLVRGKYELCPPPVMCANDPLLPASFGAVFESSKFVSPTPAQAQCWPAILSGANVLCISVTGSGKTLAYGLPMIPHISARIRDKSALISDTADASPLALVLVPTRELAIQVARSFRCFQKVASISSFAIYGGKDKEESIDELKSGFPCHIIVATPGRLIDLVGSGVVSLGNVSYLVIDEADRMLQLGFDDQLNCILSHLRPDRQSHLFSATFPGKLRDACAKWIGAEVVSIRVGELSLRELPDRNKSQSNEPELQKPKEHIATEDSSSSMCAPSHPEAITHGTPPKDMDITSLTLSRNVAQDVHVCVTHKKPRLLIRYIERIRKEELQQNTRQPGLMLIFCEKIKTLIYISNFLEKNNVVCRILHGQLNQNLREQNLNDFRSGKIPTLIATDVAARGIHIKRLQYVVNYDFPGNLEQYCHRIGRTGRDIKGSAFSLLTRNMHRIAPSLVTLLEATEQPIHPHLRQLALDSQQENESQEKQGFASGSEIEE